MSSSTVETASASVKSVFSNFSNFALAAAKQGKNAAGIGLNASLDVFHSTADKVGLRDKV
jgi:hypothetical protein